MIAYIYHWLMFHYWHFRLHNELSRFRRWAKYVAHDPQAMEYSDEAIIDGFRQLKIEEERRKEKP